MRKMALPIVFFVLCTALCAQKKPGANWGAWRFLQGKWIGEGTNENAKGSGYFSFEPDLQNKVWVRKNHAEYPGANGSTAVHDDLMVVYFDQTVEETRAFYCHSEGHIIHYTAEFSSDENKLVLSVIIRRALRSTGLLTRSTHLGTCL